MKRAINKLMEVHGYHMVPFQRAGHELQASVEAQKINSIFVRGGDWNPSSYEWQQWQGPDAETLPKA